MSHYMTALAMRQQGLKPATKIVLYWLSDHHNSETGLCCPSVRTLADECEMDRATVIRHLNLLEEMGLIARETRNRENGSQTSNDFKLMFENATPPHRKLRHPPVANCDPHNLGSNNLGSNNQKNTKKDLFSDFYEVYPKKKARGAAEKAWEKAIKKNDPEKIIEAARNFAEHSKGKDKQYLPYPAKWLNQEQWDDELEQDTRRTTTDYLNSLFNVNTKGITKQ